ncbi:MAG: TIGR01777 family oxidoreductase [Acidobacteriota bacterium]|nr:TIGR01777 family oxidoreductase [Acidobacteriota bacterium]
MILDIDLAQAWHRNELFLDGYDSTEGSMNGGELKRVVVAGGSGLVGRHLVETLAGQGTPVTVLSRDPRRVDLPAGATASGYEDLPGVLEGADAVINLAGASIAGKRWNEKYKRELLESRVGGTSRLVEAMARCAAKPGALVNASAIGFYGPHHGEPVAEQTPEGKGFLASLCAAWERVADGALGLGIRVVKLRSGVVLTKRGGALAKLVLPMKLFQGTKLGHGQQGFSWIHIDDSVGLYLEAARNPAWSGPINGTAPRPLTNETFTRLLGAQMHRPVLPVPGFMTEIGVKILLGEMASEVLEGAFVYPARALELGYTFKFEKAEDALADLLG